jgi:hypothetical protein
MQPPARPLKSEVRDVIVIGIRTSGPRAVSMLLIGFVRLILALVALLMLHLVGAEMFGFSLLSIPFASVSVISGALMLMATTPRPPPDEPEAPTQDERRPLRTSAEYGSG